LLVANSDICERWRALSTATDASLVNAPVTAVALRTYAAAGRLESTERV
jgi:hypothetical protein